MLSPIGMETRYSSVVGPGEYPNSNVPFSKAVNSTFDSLAVGPNVQITLYSGRDFTGNVVLEK